MTLGTIEIGANEFGVIKSADRLQKIDHKISVGKAKTSKQTLSTSTLNILSTTVSLLLICLIATRVALYRLSMFNRLSQVRVT